MNKRRVKKRAVFERQNRRFGAVNYQRRLLGLFGENSICVFFLCVVCLYTYNSAWDLLVLLFVLICKEIMFSIGASLHLHVVFVVGCCCFVPKHMVDDCTACTHRVIVLVRTCASSGHMCKHNMYENDSGVEHCPTVRSIYIAHEMHPVCVGFDYLYSRWLLDDAAEPRSRPRPIRRRLTTRSTHPTLWVWLYLKIPRLTGCLALRLDFACLYVERMERIAFTRKPAYSLCALLWRLVSLVSVRVQCC